MRLTIDPRLISLPAHLARQVAQAEFLIQLNDDGVFVVAEEACEGRGQGFLLPGPLGLAAGLLSLALGESAVY